MLRMIAAVFILAGQHIARPHRYADVLLDTDRFTGSYTLTPLAADLGRTAKLVLVARVDSRWYSHDG
jgi:hypothetical protein